MFFKMQCNHMFLDGVHNKNLKSRLVKLHLFDSAVNLNRKSLHKAKHPPKGMKMGEKVGFVKNIL